LFGFWRVSLLFAMLLSVKCIALKTAE